MLASTYFRNMLNGQWAEASSSVGALRTIKEHDWDEAAFVIVLDIIHGHHREVPNSLALQLLCKISVIVDFYCCHEVVEPTVQQWLGNMTIFPKTYDQECLLWLSVSWVFSLHDVFQNMTKLVIVHSTSLQNVSSLPIGEVLEKLDSIRVSRVAKILKALDDLKSELLTDKPKCSFECSTMMLGLLARVMHALTSTKEPVSEPYVGYNPTSIKELIAQHQMRSSRETSRHRNHHKCTISDSLKGALEAISHDFVGLKLKDIRGDPETSDSKRRRVEV
ncbi:hypothetical protein S40293_11325 [Stachybotrys chartarum IBT 40293]|nr:hypothetical protein S40293_11325 [Stachybotrys chartarum IBT 40293]